MVDRLAHPDGGGRRRGRFWQQQDDQIGGALEEPVEPVQRLLVGLDCQEEVDPGPFWLCKSVTDNHATGGMGFNLGIGRPQVFAAVSGSIPNSELPDKILGNSLDLT